MQSATTGMKLETIRFLDISVNPITRAELLEFFRRSIEGNATAVVGAHNVHSLSLAQNNQSMQAFYMRCDLAYVDGMPLVWLARALGLSLGKIHRVPFLDWYDEFFQQASKNGWKLFYLGGSPESSAGFDLILKQRYPGIQVRIHHGYVSGVGVESLCELINEFQPNALFVGMGMPLQEAWIVEALPYLKTNLVFAGGAMLEYLTGEQKAAPRWLGPLGMEWLYRLACRPKSLYYRYLIEPFTLLPLIIRKLREGRNYARQ